MRAVSGRTLIGLGAGVAAAGVATAAGVAADRLNRSKVTARRLDRSGGLAAYEEVADQEMVVLADDGVPLHVEIDLPRGRPEGVPDDAAVPTVVFSHGYTLTLKGWVFQRRAMKASGYRVVVWDARGHGRSGAGSPDAYNIEQLGRDLGAVIAATTPQGPLILVGHSMGGMTMMSLAVEDHELIHRRVVGAAFIATSPGGLSAVHWGLGNALGRVVHRVGPMAMGQLAGRQGLVTAARKAGKDVEAFFVERYSFASPVPESAVALMAEMIFGTSLRVMSSYLPAFERHDKREALAQFNGVETLVLNGVQDTLTPPEHSEEIVRLVPGAEHVLVNEAGHIVMLEHPELVNEQLLALAQRALRTAGHPSAGGPRPRVRRQVTDVTRRPKATARAGRSRSAS